MKRNKSAAAQARYMAHFGNNKSAIARAANVSSAAVGEWEEKGMPVWAALIISNSPDIPFRYSDFGLDPKVFLNHAINEITKQQKAA